MHLSCSDELSISRKMPEPAAIMDMASSAKLQNILVYAIQLHQSKVSSLCFPHLLQYFLLFLPKVSSEFLCCECIFDRGQTKQNGKCLLSVLFQCLVMLLCFRQGCCLLSPICMCMLRCASIFVVQVLQVGIARYECD